MARDPRQANSCTIELSTGSFIELAENPQAVLELRDSLIEERLVGAQMMELTPLIGSGRRDSEWREKVWIDPHSLVAVYPLDQRPMPPRRVYVDRIEAHDKT